MSTDTSVFYGIPGLAGLLLQCNCDVLGAKCRALQDSGVQLGIYLAGCLCQED